MTKIKKQEKKYVSLENYLRFLRESIFEKKVGTIYLLTIDNLWEVYNC